MTSEDICALSQQAFILHLLIPYDSYLRKLNIKSSNNESCNYKVLSLTK